MAEVVKHELKTLVPAIDIIEKADHYEMIADIPGAKEDTIDVTVNRDLLTITAEADISYPEGMTANYTEYGPCRYQRTFRILDDIDRENIKAHYRNGVLTLSIPKAEHMKTKKIAIEAK